MPELFLTSEIEAILSIPNLVSVVHYSGGKDSDGTLVALQDYYRRTKTAADIRLAWADTGNEWEDDDDGRWISSERWVIQRSAAYRLPLSIVRNSKRTLQQEVIERGRFPSNKNRWCTAHHKRGPLEKYLRIDRHAEPRRRLHPQHQGHQGRRERPARHERSMGSTPQAHRQTRHTHQAPPLLLELAAHLLLDARRRAHLHRGAGDRTAPGLHDKGPVQLPGGAFTTAQNRSPPSTSTTARPSTSATPSSCKPTRPCPPAANSCPRSWPNTRPRASTGYQQPPSMHKEPRL